MMAAHGQSWGRYPHAQQRLLPLHRRGSGLPEVAGSVLPRGNGRSYGDSCLNPGGSLLLTNQLDRFVSFDTATGILRCEAGVTLRDIIALTLPHGWFLPVTPGTSLATVGGAIANDVHGKNHHACGSFGHHVASFELLRSNGSRLRVQKGSDDGLFEATVGGLGLTGMITWAELRLRRVDGPLVTVESVRFGGLDDFFSLAADSNQDWEYTVAWIDCLAGGQRLGRGHFLRGNHCATPTDWREPAARAGLSLPFTPPISVVNRATARWFNALYYWKQPTRVRRTLTHYARYFYPLDGIDHWNRMYGPSGFLQYQCVLPPAAARDGIRQILTETSGNGRGSFLAVLKEFGNAEPTGLLSFPRSGTTLALDFPNDGDSTFRLMDRLDRIVESAGGAIYPAKDARMPPRMFRSGFPRWEAFAAHVDPRFSSGFWRRVTG